MDRLTMLRRIRELAEAGIDALEHGEEPEVVKPMIAILAGYTRQEHERRIRPRHPRIRVQNHDPK